MFTRTSIFVAAVLLGGTVASQAATPPDYAIYIAHQDYVLMVDPATGNRTTIASTSVGSGDVVSGLRAVYLEDNDNLIGLMESGIYRFDTDTGDRVELIDFATASYFMTQKGGLAKEQDGSLLFTGTYDTPTNRGLLRGDLTAGTFVELSTPNTGSGETLYYPYGVVCTSAGNIYLADPGSGVIQVNPSTGERTMIASSSVGTGTFRGSYGMDYSEIDGLLYITSADEYVQSVDPNTGACVDVANNSVGTGPTLSYPRGITVSHDGSLLVLDGGEETLFRIDPATGNRTVISSTGTSPVGTGPDFFLTFGSFDSYLSLDEGGSMGGSDVSDWALY
ncbi:hypothetical protein KQI84_16100 [bacterium]|nr:hypothetical protein [bacterium]